MNVTVESLKKQHGDKAEQVFREIADKGGFGAVGQGEGSIDPNYAGGLDVAGVLADGNKALSSAEKRPHRRPCGRGSGKRPQLL
jgi:hypothetical protein